MRIFTWHVEFARPLAFAILAALPLWIVFWRHSLVQLSTVRKFISIPLRVLLLAAVAIGIAGPTATVPCNEPIISGLVGHRRPVAIRPSVELIGPVHVRAGEPFTLDLLVRSESSGTARVELTRDSQRLSHEKVQLALGENHKSLPAIVEKASRAVFQVKVSGDDAAGTQRVPATLAACGIYVDPPPRVLLVESQSALAEHFTKALFSEIIDVDVRGALPAGAETIKPYDLIILSNVPADALSQSQVTALQDYVRTGGGLIAVGGDRSFTVGGYRHTPLEEMLPVISESHTARPKPTVAMVLVLDISGSMNDPVAPGAKERNIDLAKEALRRAVGMLGPRDQLGVLVFEDTSRWIWPLAPVTDKARIIAKIDTIEAGGETNMYTPLEQAYLALRESYADVKHVIVTTDGIGGPGDFDGLARKMAAAGISMSTVGVGSEPVRAFMQGLADKAKGRAYFCDNGKAIPKIFETDTGATAKIGITEEPFFPQVVRDAPLLRGLDMSQAPTLLGYVETQPRPDAQVVLAAKTGEPLLATGHYGRGTTAAFTSDIHSRWAAPWLNWPGFGRFWVQLARAVMRPDPPQPSRLTADAADGKLNITLDAEDHDGQFINEADVKVTVEQDDRKMAEHPMTQIAPGRYMASHAGGTGSNWLKAEIRRDGNLLDIVRGAAVVLSMPETVHNPEGRIEIAENRGLQTVLVWPWLLGLAAVLLVLDLAVRRTGTSSIAAAKERNERKEVLV